MSRLVDEFILMLLFTALSFLLVFYLSQNVRYGGARTYYREAVYQLQKSDYSEEAKKQCYKEAKDRGYQVQIERKTTGMFVLFCGMMSFFLLAYEKNM